MWWLDEESPESDYDKFPGEDRRPMLYALFQLQMLFSVNEIRTELLAVKLKAYLYQSPSVMQQIFFPSSFA
jgi:hypothetical protein